MPRFGNESAGFAAEAAQVLGITPLCAISATAVARARFVNKNAAANSRRRRELPDPNGFEPLAGRGPGKIALARR